MDLSQRTKHIKLLQSISIKLFTIVFVTSLWLIAVNIATVNGYEPIFKKLVYENPFSQINQIDNMVGIFHWLKLKIDFLYLIVDTNQIFIKIIYVLIFLNFLVQLILVVFPDFLPSFQKYKLIELNLNIPPFLGVIGTIFSFTLYLSMEKLVGNANDMIELFKANFNVAALTTIIGGITYTFNFFLYLFYKNN